jgi:hypothetical protein
VNWIVPSLSCEFSSWNISFWSRFEDVTGSFNRLKAPTLCTPGDNEWTDRHRSNNGGYDPIGRLNYPCMTFFNKDTSQGRHPAT